ncbi:MAG: bifunctional 2-C-methyl-D-erythritol 4-phosphate cytidylyltransferase/2-C-methyl-D-erythritol 2,4-cyclodiphosphate synthase [Pseudomonadota bacterium]
MTESSEPRWIGLLVAAGRGTRAAAPTGTAPAKQYRKLGEKTVLARSIEALLAAGPHMRVLPVIHPDDEAEFARVLTEIDDDAIERVLPPVHGGASRQESVSCGLDSLHSESVEPDTLVFIHDAARPFISPALINRLASALNGADGAVPALPSTDTLKRSLSSGMIDGDVDRGNTFAVQTPQVFRLGAIHAAHLSAIDDDATELTDDAAIATRADLTVRLVDGDRENSKLTYDSDFAAAERNLLEATTMETRVGQGFDVHRLESGSEIALGGIQIAHDKTLTGHSDADVGLHAITDALLGGLAAGDIGSHFPPSDAKWKGADSAIFLKEAVRLVAEHNGEIRFVDLTFACERPKIGPHRDAMRERIASLLGITVNRVSVKATTTERLGFTGRSEGIAAYATATIAVPAPSGDGT